MKCQSEYAGLARKCRHSEMQNMQDIRTEYVPDIMV